MNYVRRFVAIHLFALAPLIVHANLGTSGYQSISQYNNSVTNFNTIGQWNPNVTSFLLSGWYSNFSDAGLCTGTYFPVSPRPLDTSGATCYVNPKADSDISPGVVWFAVAPPFANGSLRVAYNGVYLWYVVMDKTGNYSHYMPGPCDDTGACECGPFDTVRSGWNLPSNTNVLNFLENGIVEGLVLERGIFSPSFSSSQCNIQMTTTAKQHGHIFDRFAAFQASLLETTIAPTFAPTSAQASNNMSSSRSSSKYLACASLNLLLGVLLGTFFEMIW